jgi:hypothetical protein
MSYFSRIASRSIGTVPKVGLQPAKASVWPGVQPNGLEGLEGLESEGKVSAAAWPDHSDAQAPINPTVAPKKQTITPQIQEVTVSPVRQPESAASPTTPPTNPTEGKAFATPIQPELNPLETFYGTTLSPKPITPTPPQVPQSETPQDETPLAPTPKNQRLVPESPVNLPPTLRVVTSTEGLIENLAQQPPAAKQRILPATEKTTAESRNAEEVKPPQPQPLAPPPTLPQQMTELVIGKLTVEVLEHPKPAIVTQTVPAPQAQHGGHSKSSARPDSILKYGLGQL